jgi:zinc transport system permease protein
MIMEIVNALSYEFVQRALVAGIFISLLCAVLGVFLVLKRFSLIGDGLAHVAFGGVALGLFLGVYPVYAAVPVAMLGSLGILLVAEDNRVFGDAAIGIISSLGMAGGILLASLAGGFNVDLFSYLFGNILSVSGSEMVFSLVLSLIVIVLIRIFYFDLLSLTFDEEYARSSGINARLMNRVLILLTAVSVVLAVKVVGAVLVSSLLILPAATALQLSSGFRATIVFAGIFSVLSVVAGLTLSLALNLPAGATIIVFNFFCFSLAYLWRKDH